MLKTIRRTAKILLPNVINLLDCDNTACRLIMRSRLAVMNGCHGIGLQNAALFGDGIN